MILPPDLQLQSDFAARLAADDVLAPFAITQEAEGQTEADVAQALGPARANILSGKRAGTLITVLISEDGRDEKVNIPGPQEEFSLTVRVLEVPKLAKAAAEAAGSPYRPYSWLVQRIKQLGHQFQIGTAPALYQRATPYNDGQGTIGKDVLFTWKPAPAYIPPAARPTILKNPDGSLVLTTNTAGAVVWATMDNSYPAPGNAAAVEGAAGVPLQLPAPVQPGALLRATAYLPGWIPSGVSELQL